MADLLVLGVIPIKQYSSNPCGGIINTFLVRILQGGPILNLLITYNIRNARQVDITWGACLIQIFEAHILTLKLFIPTIL